MRRCRFIALLAALVLPLSALSCPCVDTEVVQVDRDGRRLLATVSETSRVMVTAALWELLLTKIKPDHPDWVGRWQVSFFTTAEAAAEWGEASPESHVADYDRQTTTLTLWPRVSEMRQEIMLEVR